MKRIFITQRVEIIEGIKERRDALSQEWAGLALACGFLPVLVPNRPELAREMLKEEPQGIILTGGNNLVCCGGDAPERDETERLCIEYALSHGSPLLGVCRGMQMLLHYFGTPMERVEGHVGVRHSLSTGQTVNSFHGWGARMCQPPLVPLAYSGDGVVEAVVHGEFRNIQGIMWHPERYHPLREKEIKWLRSMFGI